jgi:hypothetical protein
MWVLPPGSEAFIARQQASRVLLTVLHYVFQQSRSWRLLPD